MTSAVIMTTLVPQPNHGAWVTEDSTQKLPGVPLMQPKNRYDMVISLVISLISCPGQGVCT